MVLTYQAGSVSRSDNLLITIVVVRVPRLNSLTNSGSLTVNQFDRSTGIGGVLVMRVANAINMTGSIETTGKGFQGSNGLQGDGVFGMGITGATANGNGGGADIGGTKGYGGANAGDGSAPGTGGGEKLQLCNAETSICAGDEKIFMGGAGGTSNGSLAGRAGGGIVMIFAKSIQGTSSYGFYSNGGITASEGGGAGGSIYIETNDASTSSLQVYAEGSVGGTGGGYGGGGGSIFIKHCNTTSVSSLMTSVIAGSGGESGSLITKADAESCSL